MFKFVIHANLFVLIPFWLGTSGVFVANPFAMACGFLGCILYWGFLTTVCDFVE